VPELHDGFQAAAGSLGFGLKLVFDPSDVPAALAGCAVGLAAWLRPGIDLTARPIGRRELAVLAAALLLMLADAAMPNYGLRCLEVSGGVLQASDSFGGFISADGGLSWQAAETAMRDCPLPSAGGGEPQPVSGAADLRFTQGVNIERSADGGLTWQVIYSVVPAAEVDREYYLVRGMGNAAVQNGPFAGIKDAASGNVVFTMGQEGLLLLTAGGEWRWVAAGGYSYDRGSGFARVLGLISFHIWGALAAALLAFCGLFLRQGKNIFGWILLVPAVLAWLVLALLPPTAYQTGYAIGAIGLAGVSLLAGILLVLTLVGLIRRRLRGAGRKALVGLLAGLAYLLPVLLWALRVLPEFETAAGIGLLLDVAVVAAGAWWSRIKV
jgi:hypothetical protein